MDNITTRMKQEREGMSVGFHRIASNNEVVASGVVTSVFKLYLLICLLNESIMIIYLLYLRSR